MGAYTVLVLLSSYNGEKYIKTQIDSVLMQENVDVKLLIRDDGSTDSTIKILSEYTNKFSNVEWYQGKNIGPAQSFLDLIYHVHNPFQYDFYAFCDQDDYWFPCKLSRAISCLNNIDGICPKLYYSNIILADSNLSVIPKKNIPAIDACSLKKALIVSHAGGLTMCFNQNLLTLIQKYHPQNIVMHDCWIHKLCLAMNGKTFFDKEGFILYRQHSNNVIGGNPKLSIRVNRILKSMFSNRRVRSKMIEELLIGYGKEMTPLNRSLCERNAYYWKNPVYKMRLLLAKTGLHDARLILEYKIAILFGVF